MGHDQRQDRLRTDLQPAADRFAVRGTLPGREALQVHAVVDQADSPGVHAVQALEVVGHGLRQRQQDLPVIGVLPLHDAAEAAMPRQPAVHLMFQPAEPPGQQQKFALAQRGARAAVRLEDVAVPAGAHVVDHVQGQGLQGGPHRRGEGQRRPVAADGVQGDGQAGGGLCEAAGGHVDLVSPRRQPVGQPERPLLAAAAQGIELFQHQADPHAACLVCSAEGDSPSFVG